MANACRLRAIGYPRGEVSNRSVATSANKSCGWHPELPPKWQAKRNLVMMDKGQLCGMQRERRRPTSDSCSSVTLTPPSKQAGACYCLPVFEGPVPSRPPATACSTAIPRRNHRSWLQPEPTGAGRERGSPAPSPARSPGHRLRRCHTDRLSGASTPMEFGMISRKRLPLLTHTQHRRP